MLLLDDDALIVRALARALRVAGLTVETTTAPDEARALLQRDPPDAVVSDLHMPEACGAIFLGEAADLAPGAIRVLMSADPEFRPSKGTLEGARVHAVTSKSELGALGGVLIEQLRARMETPSDDARREDLARRLAHTLARPVFEDDAHRTRVAERAVRVGRELGIAGAELATLRLGAILHDVGNIAVPEASFHRGAPLPDASRAEIEAHPLAGARILEHAPALADAIAIVSAHHERHDGTGYPNRLAAAAIPIAARALTVVDAYDAMTTGRVYAKGRTHDDAIAELRANADKQHCALAVAALADLGEDGLRV